MIHEAVANALEAEERFLLWRLHAVLSGVYGAMGRLEAAAKELDTAAALVEEMATAVSIAQLAESFRHGAYRFLETAAS